MTLTLSQAQLVIQKYVEAQERRKPRQKLILPGLSVKQRRFVDDSHRKKVARCTRRAGKSHADIVYMNEQAVNVGNSRIVYLGLTKDSAKEAIWIDMVNMLAIHEDSLEKNHSVTFKIIESKLRIEFSNGSFIQLMGADEPGAKKKMRGRKLHLLIVDECAFYREVQELIEIVTPSMADFGGTMCLTSSPGDVCEGLFYDADQGKSRHEWSQHSWTGNENPWFMEGGGNPGGFQREKETALRSQFGSNINHPRYRREWEGEWTRDESNYVYHFTPSRNQIRYDQLPADMFLHDGAVNRREWEVCMGVDLGYDPDPMAIVIVLRHRYSRMLYILDCWYENRLLTEAFARVVNGFKAKWNPDWIVADAGGLGAFILDDMNARFQIGWVHARKHIPSENAQRNRREPGKKGLISLFNDDMEAGFIQAVEGLPIIKEWTNLDKLPDGSENPKKPNHVTDACLYIHVYSHNWSHEIKASGPKYGTQEYWEKYQADDVDRVIEQQNSRKEDYELLGIGAYDDR